MIITVSRQFASGGREIGKRLADQLKLEYYDRELVAEIAKKARLNEGYVDKVLENGGFNNFAYSFAQTIPSYAAAPNTVTDVLVAQQQVIKTIGAKGDCVIVGRCADIILADKNPVKLFVYADDASKIKRCRERAKDGEDVSDKQLLKNFRQIDKGRVKLHDLLGNLVWGDINGYDLMINTSDVEIKEIIPALADLIKDIVKSKRARN